MNQEGQSSYTGGAERRSAVGFSDKSFEEALSNAAQFAREERGVETGRRMIVADIGFDIGPNPPISQWRVTVVEVRSSG